MQPEIEPMAEMISGDCWINGLQVAYAGASDPGLVRSCNEDSLLLLPESGLFAVADGLGGLDAGDLASTITLDQLRQLVERAPAAPPGLLACLGLGCTPPRMEELICTVNRHLYNERIARRKNMASTLALVQCCRDEIVVGHVGDSRLYCCRDGVLIRLTVDHSLVAELQQQGVMTADQARQSPQRHVITRAIGAEQVVEPTVTRLPHVRGDIYCLCTDGLTSMIDDEAIHACLQRADGDCGRMVQDLIDRANAAGGGDNITVVVLAIG